VSWTAQVETAGALGVLQGAANTVNGVQDGLVGIANLPGVIYNNTAGYILGAPLAQSIPSPDWSNNLITAEDPTLHAVSKGLGGTGATMLIPGAQFSAPTASLGRVSVLAQGAGGALVALPRTALVIGSQTVAVAAPGVTGAAGIAFGNVIQMAASSPGGSGGTAPNAGRSPADILTPGGQPLGRPGASSGIRRENGGLTKAQEMFDELAAGGKDVTPPGYPGKLVELPNGGRVGLRPVSGSADKSPSLDVKIPGIPVNKIHFEP
jgi:hypothetical protein